MNQIFMAALAAESGAREVDPYDIRQVVTKHRQRFVVEINQPLVLISQIQRSGGTLISQLLDGHPELYAHPGELHIGRPKKYNWPSLDLGQGAEGIYGQLFERPLIETTANGYQKQSSAEARYDPNYKDRVLPFVVDLQLQKEIFLNIAAHRPFKTQRDALNAYVTAYFNSWLDYQGMYRAPNKVRYWSCFGARLLAEPRNIDALFADYPDGKAITVLRHPVSWYASARRHSEEYADPARAMDLWCSSYTALRDGIARHDSDFLMLPFEETVKDTEASMRRVANFLGIRFRKSLLRPTFNGIPIHSDSSYGARIGIDKSATDRSHDVPADVQRYVLERGEALHAELSQIATRHRARYS